MYTYNLFQWMMFFFTYCFFGWCIESTIVSVQKRHFVNRGFLRLPMLPLYGFGAILILWITLPYKNNLLLIYIGGLIGATILEYVTGWLMESLFKMKYWDYSNQKFQLHGRICLSSSLFWGVLSVVLTEFIHPPIEKWILTIPAVILTVVTIIIAIVMCVDIVISTKAALDLAKVLEHLSSVKEEIDTLRIQLEEFKTSAQEQIEEIRISAQEQIEEIKVSAQEQFQNMKENHEENILKTKDALKEHVEGIRKRLADLTEEREQEYKKLDFFKTQLIKGHPSSYSKKFNAALKELKEKINYKKDS